MKKDFQTDAPTRQGFYEVVMADDAAVNPGGKLIAEWREYKKAQGKVWWYHTSVDPTVAKAPVLLKGVAGWRAADKAAIEKALERELTVAEKVGKSYKSYASDRSLYPPMLFPVPENRRLQVGDEVQIGNLDNVFVLALHDDGEAVTVRHDHISRRHEPSPPGQATGTWHWTDVLKVGDSGTTRFADSSVMDRVNYSNSSIDSVISHMLKCGVHDNPDYQRGYVWTEEDKRLYLDSLFEGRELGRFIFVRYDYPRGDELFDGKQRLSTLLALVQSRLPYKGIYWHELSQRDRNVVEGRSVQFAQLNGNQVTRLDLLKIFLAVNAAGVPQTEEHLNHVRGLIAEEEAKMAAAKAG